VQCRKSSDVGRLASRDASSDEVPCVNAGCVRMLMDVGGMAAFARMRGEGTASTTIDVVVAKDSALPVS